MWAGNSPGILRRLVTRGDLRFDRQSAVALGWAALATVAPRLSLKLHELGAAGDSEALADLLAQCVVPLYAIRARRKGYEVSTMKTMMEMVGLSAGPVRPPLVNVTPEEEDELRAILATWEKFL